MVRGIPQPSFSSSPSPFRPGDAGITAPDAFIPDARLLLLPLRRIRCILRGIIPDGTRPYLCKSTVVDARANPSEGVGGFLWNFRECRLWFSFFFLFFFGKDFNTMIEISLSRFIYEFRLVYLVFFSSWENFYIGINKVGHFEEDIVIALCAL